MRDGRFSGIWTDEDLPDPETTEFESDSHNLFSPDELSDLLQEFADLTTEALEEIESFALAYEANDYSAEDAGEIKRRLHSIKGSAANLGAAGIAEICHEAETAFEGMEPARHTDMLLRVKDWIIASLDGLVARVS